MAESPSTDVLVERIENLQKSVDKIESNMATKTDQANTHSLIGRIELALSQEVAARINSDDKLRDRLQFVEDRLEARKYQFGAAILLAIIGGVVGVFL